IDMAQKAVKMYRKKHAAIPKFWQVIERAAILAVLNPGKAYTHGYLTWKKEGDFLTVKLPIGRKLHYYKPEIQKKRNLYGEQLVLSYMGVESQTKKFWRLKTWGGKLTENVVQA